MLQLLRQVGFLNEACDVISAKFGLCQSNPDMVFYPNANFYGPTLTGSGFFKSVPLVPNLGHVIRTLSEEYYHHTNFYGPTITGNFFFLNEACDVIMTSSVPQYQI